MISLPRTAQIGLVCLSILILSASCGDSPTGPTEPPPQIPTRIDITPDMLTFDSIGLTSTLTAVVYDKDQNPITSAVVDWSTSDPAVVTVTRGILVSAGIGSAQITARYRNVSATADVTVTEESAG